MSKLLFTLGPINVPKYDWDYPKYLNSLYQKSEQPFTPAINNVVALKLMLQILLNPRLSQVIANKVEL